MLGLLWIYGLGSLLAVVFGHIGLSASRRTHAAGTGLAIAGLILGYAGLAVAVVLLGLGLLAGLVASTEPPASSGSTAAQVEQTPEPTKSAFRAADYRPLTTRGFDKLVKDPDAYADRQYVIYGEVRQFDAATGNDRFLANTGPVKLQASSGYTDFEQNTELRGTKSRLADVVEGDLFQAYVTVIGSFSYETQMGGSTTVPAFTIDRIKVYGSVK
ncbi:hypothetical protein HD597_007040 [Nonomuraea thailandensis]|uniref:DUF4190 domain-containing protein n=1 Tax=Nonomuraea thailandensis TaxID=1188745 RepID=A0A9X2GLP6_9ACTN|nr:hypothetical protein [Nonomuraea thailandensis]